MLGPATLSSQELLGASAAGTWPLYFWARVDRAARAAMPLSLARFPQAVHRSTYLGTDGRLYVSASGASTAILTIAPTLSINLATVGGKGVGLQWAAIVWMLGRVFVFSRDVQSLAIVRHIVNASFLGGLLDTLCEVARSRNLVFERRPAQLRVFLRKLAVGLPTELITLERTDLIDIAIMMPPPEAAPAAELPQPSLERLAAAAAAARTPLLGMNLNVVEEEPATFVTPAAMELVTHGMIGPESLGAFELTVTDRLSDEGRSARGNVVKVYDMVIGAALQAMLQPGVLGRIDIPDWIDDPSRAVEFAKAFIAAQPP